ncbi:hypothetical protein MTR67_013158 [Solanum verrucosum]|uniref:Uncharacterized protein n=1 Tax=Solanum verrucosum TaxID=315347 RepID=A0AAF0QBW0_SOLVR|nr:hypothetical protein MTR67_013158 [Solanum verrucosum]
MYLLCQVPSSKPHQRIYYSLADQQISANKSWALLQLYSPMWNSIQSESRNRQLLYVPIPFLVEPNQPCSPLPLYLAPTPQESHLFSLVLLSSLASSPTRTFAHYSLDHTKILTAPPLSTPRRFQN